MPSLKSELQLQSDKPSNVISNQTNPLGLPQRQITKEEAARKRKFSDIVDLTAMSSEDELPPPQKRSQHFSPPTVDIKEPLFPWENRPKSFMLNPSVSQHAQAETVSVEDKHRNVEIVRPISRKQALRRSTYNIKTIARDVLLATGKHPEMGSLNNHLDCLRLNFRTVENSSDLSTFRWDLVDPGEPPEIDFVPKDFGMGVDVEEEDEDAEESTSHAMKHQSQPAAPGSHSSTLSNFKIPHRRGRPAKNLYFYPKNGSIMREEQKPEPKNTRGAIDTAQHITTPIPRSIENQLQGSAMQSSANSSTGYSAFRRINDDGTPAPKKRGRPVGWRKAIHGSAAAQARTHQKPPSCSKTVSKFQEDVSSSFPIFKCEWQDCDAELHNLDTLRKHIHKVHNKEALHGGLSCLWPNCGESTSSFDHKKGIEVKKWQRMDFTSDSTWRAHIELNHLGPIAWKLGDGPMSGLSG